MAATPSANWALMIFPECADGCLMVLVRRLAERAGRVSNTADIIFVPLNKLEIGPLNVRKTYSANPAPCQTGTLLPSRSCRSF